MYYQDSFGVSLNTLTLPSPEYLLGGEEGSDFFPASVMSRIRDAICKFLPFLCRKKAPKPLTPWEECDQQCARECEKDPNYNYPSPEDFYAGLPGMIVIARYELPDRPNEKWPKCYNRCMAKCLRHRDPSPDPGLEPGRRTLYCVPTPSFPIPMPVTSPSPCPVFVF